ncbi:pentapeptide repeat-containing protein [Achromobacter kerstersii]|uniref:pentapeptide repeat-containing protein n=1 Tax=Achromobacter kerstersii TaxID=1353890 RepID=UPI003B8A8985
MRPVKPPRAILRRATLRQAILRRAALRQRVLRQAILRQALLRQAAPSGSPNWCTWPWGPIRPTCWTRTRWTCAPRKPLPCSTPLVRCSTAPVSRSRPCRRSVGG